MLVWTFLITNSGKYEKRLSFKSSSASVQVWRNTVKWSIVKKRKDRLSYPDWPLTFTHNSMRTSDMNKAYTKGLYKSPKVFLKGREVIIFPENFKNLNIWLYLLEINIKCHKRLTRDQNFWFKSIMLPGFKVYDNGLSPLPMQNPYSKIILFVNRFFFFFFLLHILWQI